MVSRRQNGHNLEIFMFKKTHLLFLVFNSNVLIKSIDLFSASDPDSLDSQHFGFYDPDPQRYAVPRIRFLEEKYKPKLQTKIFRFC